MKKVLFSAALLMVSCMTFAQVKAVKEAKSLADSKKFDQAEQLINQALTNDETKNQANTWNVAGYVQKKISEEENTKAYLKQAYDAPKMYNSIYKMFEYFTKCDELEQIPNEKGKVKIKFRKENAATLKIERPNLINGGVHYFNENKNPEAYKFFSMYIESAKNPMLAADNLMETDTLLNTIAYYATLASIKLAQDNQDNQEVQNTYYKQVLNYSQLAALDPENGSSALELEATAHKALGDTTQWLNTLKQGLEKFPTHQFFFGHLVDYYSNSGKYEEALKFADDMIAKEGGKATPFTLYVKGYLYQNMKNYDNAIEAYKKTIEADPTYAEAYSNLGLCYYQKGLEYAGQTSSDLNDPKYQEDQAKIKAFYEQARPYYEKARELKPDNRELWMNGLYTIYYNLNMAKEFEEIEKLMNN